MSNKLFKKLKETFKVLNFFKDYEKVEEKKMYREALDYLIELSKKDIKQRNEKLEAFLFVRFMNIKRALDDEELEEFMGDPIGYFRYILNVAIEIGELEYLNRFDFDKQEYSFWSNHLFKTTTKSSRKYATYLLDIFLLTYPKIKKSK